MNSTSDYKNEFLPAIHNPFYKFFFNLFTLIISYFHYTSVDFMVLPRQVPPESEPDNSTTYNLFNSEIAKIPKNLSLDSSRPLLILCNHFSWWDSILMYRFNEKVLRKRFHAMVLHKTLKKNFILNKVGGYSVDPGRRSILKSLKYTVDLLSNAQNLVLLFPQGKLFSNHIEKIEFMAGVQLLCKSVPSNCQVLALAGFIDYFSNSKPSLRFYVQKLIGNPQKDNFEELYNSFYNESRLIQGLRSS